MASSREATRRRAIWGSQTVELREIPAGVRKFAGLAENASRTKVLS